MNKAAILVFSVLILLSGCQQEFTEITQPVDKVFTAQSPLANLFGKVALKDGSFDNILDESSCTTVLLPVTVIVNNQEVLIKSKDDFKLIERIFNQSDVDEDTLAFIFPITLIMENYSTLVINNTKELLAIGNQCPDGEDEDIECIDFNYPIEFSVYNSDAQYQKTVTVTSDEELLQFINALKTGDLVSVKLPITVSLKEGSEIVINDENDLQQQIESSVNNCDEEDDNDFSDDDVDDSIFRAFLISNTWRVLYFFDGSDRSGEFEQFNFSFSDDGILIAADDTSSTTGEWKTYGETGQLELEMELEDMPPLNTLDDEWQVEEFTDTTIKLSSRVDSVNLTRILIFEKN